MLKRAKKKLPLVFREELHKSPSSREVYLTCQRKQPLKVKTVQDSFSLKSKKWMIAHHRNKRDLKKIAGKRSQLPPANHSLTSHHKSPKSDPISDNWVKNKMKCYTMTLCHAAMMVNQRRLPVALQSFAVQVQSRRPLLNKWGAQLIRSELRLVQEMIMRCLDQPYVWPWNPISLLTKNPNHQIGAK